jgi:hypothetical protein
MNGFEVKKGASLCVASVDSDLIYYSDFRVFGVFCGALSDEPNRRIFSPLIHTNFHLYQTPDALHEGRKARRAIFLVGGCFKVLAVWCEVQKLRSDQALRFIRLYWAELISDHQWP